MSRRLSLPLKGVTLLEIPSLRGHCIQWLVNWGWERTKKAQFLCFNLKVSLQRWRSSSFGAICRFYDQLKPQLWLHCNSASPSVHSWLPFLPHRCRSSRNSCTQISVTEFDSREMDLQPSLNKNLLIGCLTEVYLGIKRAIKHTLIITTDCYKYC